MHERVPAKARAACLRARWSVHYQFGFVKLLDLQPSVPLVTPGCTYILYCTAPQVVYGLSTRVAVADSRGGRDRDGATVTEVVEGGGGGRSGREKDGGEEEKRHWRREAAVVVPAGAAVAAQRQRQQAGGGRRRSLPIGRRAAASGGRRRRRCGPQQADPTAYDRGANPTRAPPSSARALARQGSPLGHHRVRRVALGPRPPHRWVRPRRRPRVRVVGVGWTNTIPEKKK